MTDVTVVIPSKNRRAMLARTLHSVLAQRDVDLQVVVVDDGGSDGTPAAVAGLGDSRVSVVRHEVSKGVSAARNAGLQRARSPWVAFVDDDDLWSPSKVRAQLDALAETPPAGWSCAGAVHIDQHCRIVGAVTPLPETDVADALLAGNQVPGGGSGTLVSRELAVAVGGFDEALASLADWDFYIRLALAAPCASVPNYHIGYFIHTQGMAHDVTRSTTERNYVSVKYAADRARRGVALGDQEWLLYLAWMAGRSGDHRRAWALNAQLLRRFPTRRNLKVVAKLAVPVRIRKSPTLRRFIAPPDDPADWAGDAPRWLAPYAHGWLEPAVVEAGGRYPFHA